MENKNCLYCKKEFSSNKSQKKYCNEKCLRAFHKKKETYYVPKEWDKSPRKCVVCGKEYVPRQNISKYCNKKCSQAFQRKKNTNNYVPAGWDKSPRKCPGCNEEYTPKTSNQVYCGPECVLIVQRRSSKGPFQEKRNCEICNVEYTTHSPGGRFCSDECLKIHQIHQKDKERKLKILRSIKRIKEGCSIYTPSHFDDLLFHNEEEFHHWFEKNFSLYGFAKIHKSNQCFPDVIAETYDGKVLRVELEYDASNFKKHGHDVNLCDMIISYVRCEGVDNIRGLPVISMFDIAPGRDRNWKIVNMNDKSLTCYFINIVNAMNSSLNQLMKKNIYCKKMELCDYIQYYSKLSA